MIESEKPHNEKERLEALNALEILDTPIEERFDRLTRLVKAFFKTDIVLISLIDAERQWFKSKQGLSVCGTDRQVSFCSHAILKNEIFEVPNATQDVRFADNPLVRGEPHIRFYAGAPLKTSDNLPVGTLCIIDSSPRHLTDDERAQLRDFADAVEDELHGLEITRIKSLLDSNQERNKNTIRLLLRKERLASLGQLASGISHEIGSPAGFIVSNVQQLQKHAESITRLQTEIHHLFEEKKQDPAVLTVFNEIKKLYQKYDFGMIQADLTELLADCHDSSIKIREIIYRLQHLSTANKSGSNREWLDINQLIESSLRICHTDLKDIDSLIFDSGEDLPQVFANQAQLMQVFSNIIGNAADAVNGIDRKSSISIKSYSKDENVFISITDNGVGILSDHYENIFDPFFTTKPAGKGTGLGMHIAYDLTVNKHGGKLYFESEPGSGTTFTIQLPLLAKNSIAEELTLTI